MKLGILLCDHVQTDLQNKFGDYTDMFNQMISRDDIPLDMQYFSVVDGELPKNIDVCDVYIASGSKASVNDEFPWIYRLEKFIWQLFLAKKGFVGICFGHQLLAKALGGKVEHSEKGWGVGVATNIIAKKKSWMKPILESEGIQVNLIVSHQEQVSQLPPECEVILTNTFCPYSMIQVGEHFLGLQGHPEFTNEYCLSLINTRKNIIGEQNFLLGTESLKLRVHNELVTTWLLNFLQSAAST